MAADYNPPPVLFRLAHVAALRAEKTASGEIVWTANPKQREVDACITAIFFAHAAVESAWHRALSDAGVEPHDWPGQFDEGLTTVAAARASAVPPPLEPELRRRAALVNAWRDFLQHGDDSSLARLRSLGAEPNPDNLTAVLAAEAVGVARELLRRIGRVTGQDLGSTNWVDPSELWPAPRDR